MSNNVYIDYLRKSPGISGGIFEASTGNKFTAEIIYALNNDITSDPTYRNSGWSKLK